MSELVIGSTLVGIVEYLVGLLAFLELFLGLGIFLVAVRVILLCRPAIGLFQLCLAAVLRDPEYFVVITL
jgi:hypothetical protein